MQMILKTEERFLANCHDTMLLSFAADAQASFSSFVVVVAVIVASTYAMAKAAANLNKAHLLYLIICAIHYSM